MDTSVVNSKLTIRIAAKGEEMSFLRNKTTMLRTTRNMCYNHFEAETFGNVKRTFEVLLINTMTELAPIIVTPGKELRVTSLLLTLIVCCTLDSRSMGKDLIQNLTFHKLASWSATMRVTTFFFAIMCRKYVACLVTELHYALSTIVPVR